MRNKLPAFLSRNRSIRAEMFWAFFFSLAIAFVPLIYVTSFINRSVYAYDLRFLIPITFVAAFFVSFYWLTRRIVNYMLTISDGLQQISDGRLDYRVPIRREDELGKVAININRMTEKLEKQIRREQQLEKTKMELITGISHDLRTPLTSIIGYLELLRSHSYRDESEYDRFVQNTYNKAVLLKKLIDDLFEYTRLASNSIMLTLKPIDVRGLLEQMLFEFEPIARGYGAAVIKRLGEKPAVSAIDSEKMARAIDNLLMNALKHSIKPGTIAVSLDTDDRWISISVENEGIPITKEQEEKLFDSFYKIDESRKSEEIQAGTGLGLSITKHIVELHGGSVTLSHEEGIYVFTASIPLIADNVSDSPQG